MKKNFKRNRILLTSLIGLAVLGSATAAFSTWIFGIQKKSAELGDITVEVDAVKDNTAYLDIKVDSTDNKIRLAETQAVSANGNAVSTEAEDAFTTLKGDFKIALSTFDFAITNDYTFDSVKFTFSVLQTGATTDKNNVNVGANDYFKRGTGDYKYIDLAKAELKISDFTKKDNTELTDYSLYTANDKFINFKWGSFFGTEGKSPADLYNAQYKALGESASLEQKLLLMQNAKKVIKDMQTAFKDAKIKITATLNAPEKPASSVN